MTVAELLEALKYEDLASEVIVWDHSLEHFDIVVGIKRHEETQRVEIRYREPFLADSH